MKGTARIAISTCTHLTEAALDHGAASISVIRLAVGKPRSALLLAALDLLLENAGLEPAQVSAVVVSRGPGSFTGIRSGLATALAISQAVGSELVCYSSLLVQAARYEGKGEVVAVQPSKRDWVYWARFNVSLFPPVALTEPAAARISDVPKDVPWVGVVGQVSGEKPRFLETSRSHSEALLLLHSMNVPGEPPEPVYVDPPPCQVPGLR